MTKEDFSPKKNVLNKTTQEINKSRQKIQFESIDAVKKNTENVRSLWCARHT